MNFRNFIIITFLLINFKVNAQFWNEYTNNPEVILLDCTFPDSLNFKGINEYKFLKTGDGGINWTITNLPIKSSAIFFIDSLNGWLSCDSARILHTTDGGISWIQQQLPVISSTITSDISNLQFININVGFGLFGNQFVFTGNGGNSWTSIPTGFTPYYTNIVGMKFIDTLHGWAFYRGDTAIYKTVDGGLSWNKYFLPSKFSAYSTFDFVDSLHGWICTENNYKYQILNTNDGGITWQIPPFEINAGKIKFRDSLVGFLVGRNSIINYTIDGGLNWVPFNNNPLVIYQKIEIFNDNIFFFGQGNTYKLTNFQNLSLVTKHNFYNEANPFGQRNKILKMNNRRYGILIMVEAFHGGPFQEYIGGYSLTNDSGRTWHAMSDHPLSDVDFVSDSLVYFTVRLVNSWSVHKSNDLFKTVQNIGTTYGQAINFTDSLHGVRSDAYTVDGGVTWLPNTINGVSSPNNSFNDFYFIDQNNGWAINGLSVFKTTDAGMTWTNIFNSVNINYITKIAFADNQNGFIISGSKLFKTTNGGLSWDSVNTQFFVIDFFFKDSLHGWITATDLATIHGLFYTSDGGQSFVQQDTNALSILSFVDNVFGYAAGSKFMTSDQSGQFISVNEVQDLDQIFLSPNPASETVTIQSPKLIFSIDLFNIQGKLILRNNIRSKSYRFDTSQLKEGVYIFKIILENKTIEKKFIVMH